jgi:hypothetical protein
MMDGLVAFLKAQLDEDEEGAQGVVDSIYAGNPTVAEWQVRTIKAMRAILAEHEPRLARPGDGVWHGLDDGLRCRVCASATEDRWLRFIAPCYTLMQLAAVYIDHPGYRQEWKP